MRLQGKHLIYHKFGNLKRIIITDQNVALNRKTIEGFDLEHLLLVDFSL